uniref:Uncharacterized protein n=1 Tax=Myoviridae sp. ctu6J18 TaxID=2827714 RepID=A0A8S5TMZ9_9CAUD|nr:MAG TPA: hypothetical protein [Myoviridae sp. ctu6J18]
MYTLQALYTNKKGSRDQRLPLRNIETKYIAEDRPR